MESGAFRRPSSVAPPLGEKLGDGRYTLLERIGQGGAGTVYRARDDAGLVPRDVCVKRLTGAFAPQHARALRDEARLLTSVRHANVVALLDVGEEADGLPFLVLEFVDGMDLRALGRARRRLAGLDTPGLLPDKTAVHVVCDVLRALAAIERIIPDLVHRDVTPHNILVSREGEIKLADFGIALSARRRESGMNDAKTVRGKFGYMAPEQIRGDPLDVRADLFSVGVVLYELFAGIRPTGAMQGMDELLAIEAGEIVPLHLHRPDLDRHLVSVATRLLSHRREQRFDHADDALRALAPFSAGELGSLRLAAMVRDVDRREHARLAPSNERTTSTRSADTKSEESERH